MNYEVQQALSRKADDWEVHALKSEIQSLRNEYSQLSNRINYLEGKIRNQYSAIEQLIQIIIDSELFVETNALCQIRQYL